MECFPQCLCPHTSWPNQLRMMRMTMAPPMSNMLQVMLLLPALMVCQIIQRFWSHPLTISIPVHNVLRDLETLADHYDQPDLPRLTQQFVFEQLHPDANPYNSDLHPTILSKIPIFNSATATFYAPSDDSSIHGIHLECPCSTPSWWGRGPRHDTAIVVEDQSKPGMQGLHVVRIKLLFSFNFEGVYYPCTLVEWFWVKGSCPDVDTGLWWVEHEMTHGDCNMSVLHLDTFLHRAHLLPIFDGHRPLPHKFHWSYTLDVFHTYFVNKYIDHASHEMVF